MNSYHPKSLLNDLQYYITPPHDCSYLPEKSARMVFLDPAHKIDVLRLCLNSLGSVFVAVAILSIVLNAISCRQCLSSRIPVAEFKMNSTQKKAWKRNHDLQDQNHQATRCRSICIMRCMNVISMNVMLMVICIQLAKINLKSS